MLSIAAHFEEEGPMVGREKYGDIQERILDILEFDSPMDPSKLLARLREEGVSREVGSAIMWEMIRAGRINRSDDWRVSRKTDAREEVAASV